MSTWLITGCSTGLGREMAEEVVGRGHNVVVTARDQRSVADFRDRYPESVLTAALDVTVPAQIADAVLQAERRFACVDVLVNNAGYGYLSAVEEGEEPEVDRLFETHFFGAVALIKAVLPGMRSRRRGTIVNVSSMGARVCPAGSGYYSAAKAALESMSFSLGREVGPLGIAVMVAEPGALRTEFAGRSRRRSARIIGDYAGTVGRRRDDGDRTYEHLLREPARAARAIVDAAGSSEPPRLLTVGRDAFDSVRTELDALSRELETWKKVSVE